MKLNLGSNNRKFDGFLNVDIRKIDGVDIVDDVTVLSNIENNSVDAIIAHNILEHIVPFKTIPTLKLWADKLKVGAWIEIGVPDGELIFSRHEKGIITRKQYEGCPWENVIHSIFGNMDILREMHGNDVEKYMHHTLFCESYLKYCMEKSGISKINRVRPNHNDNVTLRGIRV